MIDATVPDSLIGITAETRTAPKSRLPNASAARNLVTKLVRDDQPRSNRRAMVQGLIGGNPPFNSAQRAAQGRSWEANINFLSGQAMMDSSGVPYYSIFTGTEYYADCRTAYQPDNPERDRWNGYIQCRFHNLLKRWPGFDREIKQASYWMRMHGVGPIVWPNVNDWRFRSIRTGNLLVEKETPSCLDKRHRYVVVRDTMTAVELWERIKDHEGDDDYTAAGWNVSAARKTLIKSANKMAEAKGWGQDSWEHWQQEFKNNDLGVSAGCEAISVAHLFVQEFSGKVSHVIVTESPVEEEESAPGEPKKDSGFLFRAIDRYDDYQNALGAFFLDSGDGTWHSVRGIADKAFSHLAVENRLKCAILDAVRIRSSLILRAKTDKAKKAIQLTVFGATTVLGPDAGEVVPMQVGTDIEAALLADRTMSNHLANNIGVFQQRTMSREDGRGEVPTATQVNQQVLKESSLSQAQISEFYFPLDRVVAEIFRRAVESTDDEAKRFRDECEKDGVPIEALRNMEYVRFNRTAGYGSPQMRLLQSQQIQEVLPMMNEEGRQNWLNDHIGGVAGADKIDRYNPKEIVPQMDDAMAGQENASIRAGLAPIHYSGENHVSHLEIHTADAEAYLAPLQEAMDAGENDPAAFEQAFNYVGLMAEHCQGHLEALAADPTRRDVAEMFEDKLNFIASFSGKLRSAIIRAQREAELMAQEEEQANVLGALDEAKIRSAEVDMALKTEKTRESIKDKRTKTIADIRRDNLKTAVEVLRETKKLKQKAA